MILDAADLAQIDIAPLTETERLLFDQLQHWRREAEWIANASDDAVANLNQARSDIEDLEGKVSDLEAECDELRAARDNAIVERDDARRERDEALETLDDLKADDT